MSTTMEIGDRIKIYENENEKNILPYYNFILRLDGKNFSKFTKGLKKPFDKNFTDAMVLTMNDLINKFKPRTGYTHSDEITLIFSNACAKEEYENKENKSVHFYNGRILKINTVVAGYCSVRFAFNFSNIIKKDMNSYKQQTLDKIFSFETCFDCRTIIPPTDKEYEIVNHMIWRSIRDCPRNTVATYARHYYTNKELFNKDSSDMIKMLLEKGLDWNKNVPIYDKHGVYCKKELYDKEVEINGNLITVQRSRFVNYCFKINEIDNPLETMLEKYWNNTDTFEKFTCG
jgi:tRNA(His) 5'-end guanylyltransferase